MRPSALHLFMLAAFPLTALPAPVEGQAPAAGQAPVMVSANWLAEHRAENGLVLIHVAILRDGAPEESIPGSSVLEYRTFADERDGLSTQIQPVEQMVDALRAAGVSNSSQVVLYGSPLLAARLLMTMEVLGHAGSVSYLDGGVAAWKARGGEVTAELITPAPGDFEARVQEDIVVSAEWIRDRLNDSKVTLLDARPADEYTGARTPGDLRPGHIPGAYNLYWEDFIDSRDNPVMEAFEDARARIASSGVGADDMLVSYCYIGMRASYNYMVARHLGYNVRFYDGSWDEWARRADLPAVQGSARR